VAEILFQSKPDSAPIEELMAIARIWRLDIGESVIEAEKYYEYESRDREGLPISLRGRILEDNEIVDNINVADSDVLLYEV
jgi:hypothetical protein